MSKSKLSYLAHTEIAEIDCTKLSIDKSHTVKISKNKNHELILKTPIFKLGKYPLQTKTFFDPNNNRIDLQFEMGPEYKSNNFYQFYNSDIKKLIVNLDGALDNNSEQIVNKLKISHLESFNYPVYEITLGHDRPYVKQYKPSNKEDLYKLFKPDYEFVAFVQLKMYYIKKQTYVLMVPTKFYIGENLTDEIISVVTRKYTKQKTPPHDYYDPRPIVTKVDKDMLLKSLE
jgi:hypothetical protein